MRYQSFHPTPRTLMGPGPSDVHPRILEALARPTVGHLDPRFIDMMDECKAMLQQAFLTTNALTLPVSAPGSAGMETCFVNLVEPGDEVVVCRNGVFGMRMSDNVERCGGVLIPQDDPWGEPVSAEKLEATLSQHPNARIVAFVHAETSTGACSDVKTLTEIAHRHGCLVIVDAVTSLGGVELRVDDWEVDAIYSGTQKCLSCVPGLSPVSFNDRAVAKIRNRSHKVQSWFLDLNLVMGYWGQSGKRAYHHTAPVNSLYALHESLVMLLSEGLDAAWARHRRNHDALRAGLETLGMRFVVAEGARLPQLNSVWIPEGHDDATVRSRMLNEFNLEIGAGLGDFAGRVWRIGLMGYSSKPQNVLACLSAFEALGLTGTDSAIAAAQRLYDQ